MTSSHASRTRRATTEGEHADKLKERPVWSIKTSLGISNFQPSRSSVNTRAATSCFADHQGLGLLADRRASSNAERSTCFVTPRRHQTDTNDLTASASPTREGHAEGLHRR
eukprot:7995791-Pyramimonas_sp.AAC.1